MTSFSNPTYSNFAPLITRLFIISGFVLFFHLISQAQPNLFGPQNIITNSLEGAISIHASDLDGDGDQDVISASVYDDKVAWYENDGNGIFGEQYYKCSS